MTALPQGLVRLATAAAQALLEDVAPHVDVFTGLDAKGPQPHNDPDGRVHVYAVIYPFAGQRLQEQLAAGVSSIAWGFQVTCAGGDTDRALACIDAVASLNGRRLSGDGWSSSPLTEQLDPGPILEDRDASPSRWYAPLQFATNLTTAPTTP